MTRNQRFAIATDVTSLLLSLAVFSDSDASDTARAVAQRVIERNMYSLLAQLLL